MRTHPVLIAGGILGLGIGGFFDGIVLHQILQWHHMICVTAHCQALTLDHQILGVHHVLPGSPHWFAADMAFLASGVVFFLVGWSMLPPATVQRIPAYA